MQIKEKAIYLWKKRKSQECRESRIFYWIRSLARKNLFLLIKEPEIRIPSFW